jgi:hypothetical protein
MNYTMQINTLLLTDAGQLGIRDTLYGRVELTDGTLGPVVEFTAEGRTPAAELANALGRPGVVAPPAAPRTVDINGSWEFRRQGAQAGDPAILVTFSGFVPGNRESKMTIAGDGFSGTGTFNGSSGSVQLTNGRRSPEGMLVFRSDGLLTMYVQPDYTNRAQEDGLPSGSFVGVRR